MITVTMVTPNQKLHRRCHSVAVSEEEIQQPFDCGEQAFPDSGSSIPIAPFESTEGGRF